MFNMQVAIAILIILVGGIFFGGIGLYFTLGCLLKDNFELNLLEWFKEIKDDENRNEKLMLRFRDNYITILHTVRAYIIFVFIVLVFAIIILPLIILFG